MEKQSVNSTFLSSSVVLSSVHGRLRREQRNIAKCDLEAAVKYGKKEQVVGNKGEQQWMYTFADIVYLTDSTSTKEITSWPMRCCGIDVPKKHITSEMHEQHKRSISKLKDKSLWKSHTVAVVDQSGSMRKSDASEGATRSDVVWLTLALDLIGKKLKSLECSDMDVFSLISMRSEGEVLLKEKPTDWLLYNDIIDLLRTQHPRGDGNYIPALDTAEKLLQNNSHASCALLLIFLSDGRPSDKMNSTKITKVPIGMTTMEILTMMGKQRVSKLASIFGRRLTIGAIGFGQPEEEDFVTLKGFVEAANEYGCIGTFKSASLSAETLADIFTTLSSTLTTTKSELTEIGGSNQRKVKPVFREPISSLGDEELSKNWLFFPFSTESGNIVKTRWTRDGWKPIPRRYIFSSEEVTGIALKKRFFGEGAERLVREFREVGKGVTFIGSPMVAKESRFESDDWVQDKKEFHKIFCKTQKLAQRLANVFNKRLQNLPFAESKNIPYIKFLECCVFMVNDPNKGRYGLLVEKMLDIKSFKYQKWNSNDGLVLDGKNNDASIFPVRNDGGKLEDIIEEEEDEWDESDNENEEINENFYVHESDFDFNFSDIPQIFSCFTYRYTKRKMLVCDLQGVFNTSVCPPVFEMTDPVIHYRSKHHRRHVYGRTDKGLEGIHNFFRTHKHSKLCYFVHKKWVKQTVSTVRYN